MSDKIKIYLGIGFVIFIAIMIIVLVTYYLAKTQSFSSAKTTSNPQRTNTRNILRGAMIGL